MDNIKKDCRNDVKLKLSIDSKKEDIISNLQKDIIKEDLERFEPIKENDINISTSYVFDLGDKLEASVFFRNALNRKINFDKVPLSLVDNNGNIITNEIFSLRELGDIPPNSARPWKLYFSKENITLNDTPSSEWKVVFGKNVQALNTVKVTYEDMKDNIDVVMKNHFQSYLESLPLLKKGQISINTYNAMLSDDEKINIVILVRNGTNKKVKLEKLPVTVYDKDKRVICSLYLDLKFLEVNPSKAKLYKLVINFDREKYSEYDFEKLYVEFKTV